MKRIAWICLVLIETYWNVKLDTRRPRQENRSVLIETYWNVKVFPGWLTG